MPYVSGYMTRPPQRIIKQNINVKSIFEFFSKNLRFAKNLSDFVSKNWQAVAVILGIAAIFIWYQALNMQALNWGKAFDGVSLGIKETTKKLSPSVVPQIPIPLFQPQKEPIRMAVPIIFSEKARRNQGITHLARQALNEYLESVKPNIHLSKEQKIYIEDYLKNKTGKKHVLVGQVFTFNKDMITRAIDLSQHLSQKQLSHLKKYVARVPSLKPYAPIK